MLNEARLLIDGEVVDKKKIFYGDKNLTATAQDGAEIVIELHSGMVGELTAHGSAVQMASGSTWRSASRNPEPTPLAYPPPPCRTLPPHPLGPARSCASEGGSALSSCGSMTERR